ncbi:MAG: cysS [Parcubacteria group bacterium]|nr:cysS [Parcubacteria group bacterium]
MWPFKRMPKAPRSAPVFLTNTLSGKKEVFVPLKPGVVTLYSCGPTVYSTQHIGNMRGAVFADLVARLLLQNKYHVRRVINITDVGHLTGDNEGDADQGEDRMEKGARLEGLSAHDLAERYTKEYLEDIRKLNVTIDDILFPRATQYIAEQIEMVKVLEKKGHTYRIHDGVYFDTSTFPKYGELGGIPLEYLKNGSAADVHDRIALSGHARIKENKEKRNPADFALWKSSPLGSRRQQEWSSPWGRGFPGWHIECSAMSKALLGETIDIHTGGIEHIPVHHNNEIAQSESASEKQFVRYWMHQAHLTMGSEKISKSIGNTVYVSDIIERGYHPLALRYFFLQASYHSSLSFSWEALAASNEALNRLWRIARELKSETKGVSAESDASDEIRRILRDDLATPKALALLWETVRDDELSPKVRLGVLLAADEVLGLSLSEPPSFSRVSQSIPADVQTLVDEREAARSARDFARADELRIHIENRGYTVEDSPTGVVIVKK